MPHDGLCLHHAVRYAHNPQKYDGVATAQNGMLVGAGSDASYQAAAGLRRELIDAVVSEGQIERATRLMKMGSDGYPEEEDFAIRPLATTTVT